MNKEEIVVDNGHLIHYLNDHEFYEYDTLYISTLDYLEKLQQENKQLKEKQKFLFHIRSDTTELPAVVRKSSDVETIKELQQENFKLKKENKQLQQENEKLKLNHKQLSDISKMAICNSRLIQENKQLKDNWNKLKEIVKSQSDFKSKCHNESLWFEVDELLNKMKELEKGDSNENN